MWSRERRVWARGGQPPCGYPVADKPHGSGVILLAQRGSAVRASVRCFLFFAPDSVALVTEWLAQARLTDGKMFRSLCNGRIGTKLGAGEVSRIFKRMARDAGLPVEMVAEISGHSTRVGATQDMIAEGIGMGAIMQAGR